MKYMFYHDETADSDQRICSLAYVVTDEGGADTGEGLSCLVDPECGFGTWQQNVHHITAADVAGKPTFGQVCERTRILSSLSECVFVAHNAGGAFLHHLGKSLAAYGSEMPPVRFVDTMDLAGTVLGRPRPSLAEACAELGVDLDDPGDASCCARACRDVFWKCAQMAGVPEPEGWEPSRRRARRLRPEGTLGLVHDTERTLGDVVAEFDWLGLLRDPDEVELAPGTPMVFSGTASGMGKGAIADLLEGHGMRSSKGVSGNTRFLAFGDNVGQSKLDDAKRHGTPVVVLADLIEHLRSLG